MIDKILKIGISIIGVLLGIGALSLIRSIEVLNISLSGWIEVIAIVGFGLLFGIIFYFLSSGIIKKGKKLIAIIENELQKNPGY